MHGESQAQVAAATHLQTSGNLADLLLNCSGMCDA